MLGHHDALPVGVQETVSGFQPKAEDLQYPEKLMNSQGAAQEDGTPAEAKGATNASTHEMSANGTAQALTSTSEVQYSFGNHLLDCMMACFLTNT